jgi:TPR repeat protein
MANLSPGIYKQNIPEPATQEFGKDIPVPSIYRVMDVPEAESQSLVDKLTLVQSLNSPTIHPPIRIIPVEEGAICIISAIVEPGGLNNNLLKSDSLPKWTSTTPAIILYGVATALKLLHAADCPHGSVSLGNVLLNEDLEPSLSDCGVWLTCDVKRNKHGTHAQRGRLSRADRLFSLPPEENPPALKVRPTKAADVYGFGCLFYMLLKKGAPLPDNLQLKNVRDVKAYLTSDRKPSVDGLAPIAAKLIDQCCAKDPKDRPTIEEVISVIEANPTELGFVGVDQNAFNAYVGRVSGGGVGQLSKAGYLEKLVRAGSASAAFFLGEMFETGDGVEKDAGRALSLYRQSGGGGCPFGNLRAGLLLRETDPVSASKYFESAALSGNSDGLNELGELTEAGVVTGGVEAAAELYGKAALLGNKAGLAKYLAIAPKLPREEAASESIEEERLVRGLSLAAEGEFENAAAEFRIAAAGSGDALFSLGWLAEQGRIKGNAEEFYRDAISRGSARAQNNLGVLLIRSGRKDEGYELISQAARRGDAYGMNNIAIGIENGDYAGDIRVVAGLYRDAALGGVIEAFQNYASIIGAGIGIEQNAAEAQRFLGKAKQKRATS